MDNFFDFFAKTMTGVLLLCMVVLMIKVIGESEKPKNYESYTDKEFNALTPPVILIGKEKSFDLYSISVKDRNNKVLYIGNMSGFANSIGEQREVGDTLINLKK